ncbi:MAG TPA: DnaB-like helicase N-terminal domain-containing protein, partial [Candidatus Obscuribacterales bacterium]
MSSEVSISDGLLERLPPQSIEAEQAVLGALLVSGDGISRVVDVLDPDYFYRKAHQVIYAAMLDLYENNEPIDIVTVSQYLKDEEKLEHVGGRQYITDLALAVATTANLEYYAKVVQEKALLRQLIKAGTEIVGSCYEEPDANIAIDRAEHLIFTLAERRNMQQLVHIKHIVEASFQRIEQRYEQRDSLSGIPSGFYDLDALTSGFQPSDLIIVAARPSMGKCLAYDSELVLADGSIATIEEIYRAKEARLLTLSDDLKLNWTQPSAFVDDGIKPVFRVVTRLGRTIETTLPHPFLTLSGWKKLSELKAGDKIALPRGIPVFGKHSMRECEVKLLAYLIGDGCLTNGKVSFTNSNPRIQEEFCQAVSEFGSVVARREESRNRTPSFVVKKNYRKKHRERKQLSVALKTSVLETFGSARKFALAAGVSPSSVCHWTKGACIPSSAAVERIESTLGLSLDKDAGVPISSLRGKGKNAITQWLEKLDLMGKGAHDKIVPAQIFRLQKEQIALFLNRLFATDGWATVLNSGQSQFGYCTVSERLARQISHLLLRFNIICKVRTRKIKYGAEQCVAYQLDITDKESIERFCNEIGIFGKEEAVERVRNQ